MRYHVRGSLSVWLGLGLLCMACVRAPRTPTVARAARSPQAAVDELLAVDRAFAAASARTDAIAGLTPMFAADVVMPVSNAGFADGVPQVIAALRADPEEVRSRLEWTPIRGGVAADGQHGFTFGYMTRVRPDSTQVLLKYLAYWVKGDRGWRVVAYKRGPRAAGDEVAASRMMPPALPERLVPPRFDSAALAQSRARLAQTERDFSDRAQVVGLRLAFAEYGSPDAVNMGGPNEATFVIGAEAIARAVSAGGPATGSPLSWAPDHRVIVATSDDLGITFGMIRPNAPGPAAHAGAAAGFPFFTIWRRASPRAPWRYIAE